MSHKLPKISIITIVFNGFDEIKSTIESVLNQNYDQLEYIIIDGASTDGTQQVIERYLSSISYFVSEKDNGISDAFNKGISKSTGDLIGLLNAGDVLCPHVLHSIANAYSEDSNTDKLLVLHGKIQMGIPNGKVYSPFKLSTFKFQMPIWHPTIYVNKEVYEKFRYSSEYKIAMDYDLFSRVYNYGAHFKFINETIVSMDTNGLSNQQAIKGFKEVMFASRNNLKVTNLKSALYFFLRCVFFFLGNIKRFKLVKYKSNSFFK